VIWSFVQLFLSRDPTAVRTARHAVASELDRAFGDDVIDRARVLVSELVTNALLHGRGAPFLCVEHGARRVRVEVGDDGPVVAGFKPSMNGRGGLGGVFLDKMADRWGIEPSGREGKKVWFEISEPSR
jgi:anti-sigma regulatory factor (Ser/Thr protein kinase)